MKFGLEVQVIENIISVLEQHPKVDKAFVFGSRAKGNYRPDSDIDIAIKGNEITTDDIIAISVAIETKGITHKFDLIDYNSIKELALKEHIDRVGIEFYSRWKTVMLQEIVSKLGDGLHGSPEYDINGEYFFINGNNLIDGKIVIKESTQRVSEKEYLKYKKELNDRTILLGINGTIGNVALYNGEKCILGKSACYFNVIDSVNKEYIKYVITDKTFQSYIENFANGSTIMNVSLKVVREYEFSLPPYPEQTAIASILSSLDDKIDLLQRQNKTLEQLAETLFRQWFVEEAEVDLIPLKKYVDVIDNRGKTPPFSDINTDYPIVEVKSLSNNDRFVNYDACEKFVNEETYNSWFRKGHPIINDILISTVGSIGEMAYVIENKGGIAQNVIGLRAKGISPYYLYQYLSLPKTRNLIKDLDIGAVQPSIKVPHLLELEIIIPKNKQLIKDFDAELVPIFEKMKINHNQIRTLTQTRDTLLPKLMSGEMRVCEYEQ